jgi:hypothetical protein
MSTTVRLSLRVLGLQGRHRRAPCTPGSAQPWGARLSAQVVVNDHLCLRQQPRRLHLRAAGRQLWLLPGQAPLQAPPSSAPTVRSSGSPGPDPTMWHLPSRAALASAATIRSRAPRWARIPGARGPNKQASPWMSLPDTFIWWNSCVTQKRDFGPLPIKALAQGLCLLEKGPAFCFRKREASASSCTGSVCRRSLGARCSHSLSWRGPGRLEVNIRAPAS